MNNSKKILVGSGVVVLAAAAAAFLLYGSKDGHKRRAKLKGWAVRAKGEMIERFENIEHFGQGAYNKIVDEVSEKYRRMGSVEPSEIKALVQDAKSQWKNIKSSFDKSIRQSPKKPKGKRKIKTENR